MFEELLANPYFQGIEERSVRALAGSAAWRELTPGEIAFLGGSASAGLYYVQSRWLKIVKISPEGREQVLRFAGPGETLNAVAAFANRPNPATAIAWEPAGVWLLRREAVLHLLEEWPAPARQVIGNVADRLVELVRLVEDLSLPPVTGRLARMLLEEADGGVLHRPRWHTQAGLAAQLGTVPVVIQRALSALAGQGAIEVERYLIRIKDRAALENLAGQAPPGARGGCRAA